MCLVSQGVREAFVFCLSLCLWVGKVEPVCEDSVGFLFVIYAYIYINIYHIGPDILSSHLLRVTAQFWNCAT